MKIRLTSICTILSVRKSNQQTFFFLVSSEHSMPNPLPPNPATLKTKSNTSKTNTLNVPEQITKKPFLTGNKPEGDNVLP